MSLGVSRLNPEGFGYRTTQRKRRPAAATTWATFFFSSSKGSFICITPVIPWPLYASNGWNDN